MAIKNSSQEDDMRESGKAEKEAKDDEGFKFHKSSPNMGNPITNCPFIAKIFMRGWLTEDEARESSNRSGIKKARITFHMFKVESNKDATERKRECRE
ncbi:hypothetical protein TWF706_004040 [Orbilia oligospora]|uniref:Uncharacterized protein n=1 Tax=Orbilia oligospora TaxID=2813651 RepID=A0A7C8NTM6_ORBOL|nr:hypothetical protein TWF706_004040 [Orbilia oligospora]KAF3136343.1 hypothetical protein TWF703_005452 [Orbilia oligospora]